MREELDEALRARLHAALDAAPLVSPDPAQARYRAAAIPVRPAVAPPALGFVAGVAATVAFALLTTGSAEPQVWLQRAAGGVHRITDIIEPASNSTPVPAETPTEPPSPSPVGGGAVAPPAPRSTPEAEHDRGPAPSPTATPEGGERSASPGPVGAPAPSPSSDGGGGDHDGQMAVASPSPSASSGSEGH